MLRKFAIAGLLTAVSFNSFAEVDMEHKVLKENMKAKLDANCRVQIKANIDSIQQQLESSKSAPVEDLDALKIAKKRLSNPNISCRGAIEAASILAEQLDEKWIPAGVFLTMGLDVSLPFSIPAGKLAFNPGGQFLVGTGVFFPIDGKGLGAEAAALSMYGWHVNGHAASKPASALEANMALVFPIGYTGEFKSIDNMSGSYVGINFDIPFSNSTIKNTAVVGRVFLPVSSADSSLDEISKENITSIEGLRDLIKKVKTLRSNQRPAIVVVGVGVGGKDPAFQLGIEKMTVHATKYSE